MQEVALSALCKSVIADRIRLAESKQIDLGLVGQDAATVTGDPATLRILLNNLVDNAIRYAGSHARVDLVVHRSAEGIVLEVRDDGPGIAEGECERVLERFYRGGDQRESGSGLGLSIVRRIAEQHGARVMLGAGQDGQGLRVQVIFARSVIPSD